CPSSSPKSFIRRRRCRGYLRSHSLWEEWKMSTCLMTLLTLHNATRNGHISIGDAHHLWMALAFFFFFFFFQDGCGFDSGSMLLGYPQHLMYVVVMMMMMMMCVAYHMCNI
ncbi:unnamed protein product, partial [Musa textilis]